ncbi:MAG TPA: type II toxin-antitoxin system RelE/ParE family toxin [Candidatus Nanoarchaeia archaeon]|nr:type II toxin-antitoxin system RelE/ParE family toxin [Candidatus Nanoarchaeia archaeon]
MYSIKWNPRVIEYLEKLPEDISSRIAKKIEQIKENPFHYLEHYEGDKVYKLRIGDYRALIDVDLNNRVLYIQVIDLRSRIYKRR